MGGLDLFDTVGPASAEGAWTVSEVTAQARRLVETGFERVWVRGEISGFKSYQSGHWYFTLRDRRAQVRCVMWRTDNERLKVEPVDGAEVYVAARPTLWEERGEFRLTVKEMIATTADGLWQLKLEQARAALEKDGLLDAARKRPLPPFPRRVAVVTSLDGAALKDITTVVARRWTAVELWVVPSSVQGDRAEGELCYALNLVNRLPEVDCLIVGRGGGSREDLWVFNSERVARAVAAVNVPTVSAVGHETDVTLTDLVADVRAATPSAAAEAVVPDRQAVEADLARVARALAKGLTDRTRLTHERLARTGDRLMALVTRHMDARRARLDHVAARLEALSPLRVLARGYAVARDAAGNVLRTTGQLTPGTPFRLTVADGEVAARVERGPA